MKLEEAIEDLTKLRQLCDKTNWKTHAVAIKLGIEALKFVDAIPVLPVRPGRNLLPGETED